MDDILVATAARPQRVDSDQTLRKRQQPNDGSQYPGGPDSPFGHLVAELKATPSQVALAWLAAIIDALPRTALWPSMNLDFFTIRK
ncbi:MAG TPA: hypothetical protein VN911_17050 [Candidatus Acidoferrum sp.]|nr:hypothetical protein [Candidatus Acidoferrum sp.]